MKLVKNLFLVFCAMIILGSVTVIVKAQTTAETAKENVKKNSDYALPYPGILPDNPLYNLKVFRDKVFEFLIIDPLKKSDFYLLQADKRLAAGESLLKKGQYVLGEQTISKAEKYFLLALHNFSLNKENSDSARDLNNRLKRSSEKHQEVISSLLLTSPASLKEGFNVSLKMTADIERNLTDLLLKQEAQGSSSPDLLTE